MEISAVSAYPSLFLRTFEDDVVFHIVCEFKVTVFVTVFDYGDIAEEVLDFLEPFFFGDVGEAGIHLICFVVFTSSGGEEIFECVVNGDCRICCGNFDGSTLEEFEFSFCVFFFLVRGFGEDCSNLFIAFFFCF